MKKFKEYCILPGNFLFITIILFSIHIILTIFTINICLGAARGSGTYSPSCIGSPCQKLYLPATQEEKGWLSDASTNSLNVNSIFISSAINRLEVLGGNTNYILNQPTLQSGSVFYVASASVDGQTLLARTSGRVGIGTTNPGVGLDIEEPVVCLGDGGKACDVSLTQPTLQLTRSVGGDATILFAHASSSWTIGARNGGGLYISSSIGLSNSPMMVFTSSAIGIGTIYPSNALSVVGAFTASSSTTGGSVGQVTISTSGILSNSRACASGFTRIDANTCYDSDGDYTLLKTSAPTATNTTTGTITASALVGRPLCALILWTDVESACGSAGLQTTKLHMAGPNQAIGTGATALRGYSQCAATQDLLLFSEFMVPTNTSAQVVYICNASVLATGATSNCDIYLSGYKECSSP